MYKYVFLKREIKLYIWARVGAVRSLSTSFRIRTDGHFSFSEAQIQSAIGDCVLARDILHMFINLIFMYCQKQQIALLIFITKFIFHSNALDYSFFVSCVLSCFVLFDLFFFSKPSIINKIDI